MPTRVSCAAFALALALLAGPAPASAQNQPDDKAKQQAAEQAKRDQNEFAEIAKHLPGPAGNPECVAVGRRVVTRLFQNDPDTALRHLDLYDRFGCPGGHVQAAFRCVVKQGLTVDPKTEDINKRVHSCWVNPAAPPAPAAAVNTPATGTTTQ